METGRRMKWQWVEFPVFIDLARGQAPFSIVGTQSYRGLKTYKVRKEIPKGQNQKSVYKYYPNL